MSTAFNKPSSEFRVTIKSGLIGGLYPDVVGKGTGYSGKGPAGGWPEAEGLVSVRGFNYHQHPDFDATHPLRARKFWYSLANHQNRTAGKQYFNDAVDRGLEAASMAGQSGQRIGFPDPAILTKRLIGMGMGAGGYKAAYPWSDDQFTNRGGQGVSREDSPQLEILKQVHNGFKRASAKMTGTLLRELNDQLFKQQFSGGTDIREQDHHEADELTLRKGAHPSQWASEEQTAILADQSSAETADDLARQPIGLTQPIDAYIKVGNKFIAIDVTEAMATGENWSSHHSLTGGPIWKSIDAIPKSQKKIREDMKTYYNNEITTKWNPHLGTIKKMASHAYGVDEKQLTAEMMRAPTGLGGAGTQHDVARQSQKSSDPSKHIQQRRGGGASITARRLAGMSKKQADKYARKLGGVSAGKMTQATAKHLMHGIGNWANTVNGMWDTFTLSHTPAHVTAGVLLRNYRSGARKFLYKKVRMEDVQVFDGPATHGLVQHLGGSLNKTSAQILGDQMTGHLIRRVTGKKTGVVNSVGITAVAASSAGDRGFSAGIHIPHGSLEANMARIVEGFLRSRTSTGWARSFHDATQSSAHSGQAFNHMSNVYAGFNAEMARIKEERSRQLAPQEPEADYQFWAMPYYGIDSIEINTDTN